MNPHFSSSLSSSSSSKRLVPIRCWDALIIFLDCNLAGKQIIQEAWKRQGAARVSPYIYIFYHNLSGCPGQKTSRLQQNTFFPQTVDSDLNYLTEKCWKCSFVVLNGQLLYIRCIILINLIYYCSGIGFHRHRSAPRRQIKGATGSSLSPPFCSGLGASVNVCFHS